MSASVAGVGDSVVEDASVDSVGGASGCKDVGAGAVAVSGVLAPSPSPLSMSTSESSGESRRESRGIHCSSSTSTSDDAAPPLKYLVSEDGALTDSGDVYASATEHEYLTEREGGSGNAHITDNTQMAENSDGEGSDDESALSTQQLLELWKQRDYMDREHTASPPSMSPSSATSTVAFSSRRRRRSSKGAVVHSAAATTLEDERARRVATEAILEALASYDGDSISTTTDAHLQSLLEKITTTWEARLASARLAASVTARAAAKTEEEERWREEIERLQRRLDWSQDVRASMQWRRTRVPDATAASAVPNLFGSSPAQWCSTLTSAVGAIASGAAVGAALVALVAMLARGAASVEMGDSTTESVAHFEDLAVKVTDAWSSPSSSTTTSNHANEAEQPQQQQRQHQQQPRPQHAMTAEEMLETRLAELELEMRRRRDELNDATTSS